MSTGVDRALAERIARGEYVVDEHAVAEAMMRRLFGRPSLVLVPPQPFDRPPVRPDDDEAVSGGDAA